MVHRIGLHVVVDGEREGSGCSRTTANQHTHNARANEFRVACRAMPQQQHSIEAGLTRRMPVANCLKSTLPQL
eukprot:1098853-Rhodomonas_salina.1